MVISAEIDLTYVLFPKVKNPCPEGQALGCPSESCFQPVAICKIEG